ncbi:MAG: bifunctional aconitate hydratase 2/2-methylisocitrate dehydratase [Proteobacteria bacterium]|nr:bifunctional aconitate hydratase 2/2-methylisocitrate dehydratase [Pseudomonadota bacterium]MBU1686957.1 bifunctional aconitate hydratase 2/2-methylisocitrate dehydratase [Pseudomonadota bacterium]
MIEAYRTHVEERAALNLPPLPLNAEQTSELIALIRNPPPGEDGFLVDLLTNRIPPGVDGAAEVKAGFLSRIARGDEVVSSIDRQQATFLLGTMLGGYNIQPLIDLLDDPVTAEAAATALSGTVLVYDAYSEVMAKAKTNSMAKKVVDSWAAGAWFTNRAPLAERITVTVFKVPGESNTDDFSPASEAWSRPDIPLHAQSMLKSKMPDGLALIEQLKSKGHPVAFVGDVVGTGSSRKSAINSVLWYLGHDIPYVPNKRQGGVVLGGKIAPIFFNTAEDSGALPIECEVSGLKMGEVVHILPYDGKIVDDTGMVLSTFTLRPSTMADEVRAGGRIPLIIGRALTDKIRKKLGQPDSDLFLRPVSPPDTGKGFTLAQKIVGLACDLPGVRPGTYCEPRMSTVGSQDTTGAMTRDELKELACLGFSADLVMQSFCHTAAYPKPVDVKLHHELPGFFEERGGVALRPRDGVIHSWLNRMVLPDTVGTGGDSHTRFPIGISFPAGSGLVAFGASIGVMPLDLPESVLIRFTGKLQPGITLRDLVNAIPHEAIRQGLLTVGKEGKKNVFSGRILEIEGLPDLKVEQAFELSDASAERSAAACTVRLNKEPVVEFVRSNAALLKWLIEEGYQDRDTLQRRVAAMEAWLADPQLLVADDDAEYAAVVEIDLNTITEPILACPNDPDDVKKLSELEGTIIDEVFIGSCMTNIGHYRAAARLLDGFGHVPTRLWIAPPTRMDERQLVEEGIYAVFGRAGARTEVPGCSLCMGNQARVADGATVISTSTRNFPQRMGDNTEVYLGSAELAAITAKLGALPSLNEYQKQMAAMEGAGQTIYTYLNFDRIAYYTG